MSIISEKLKFLFHELNIFHSTSTNDIEARKMYFLHKYVSAILPEGSRNDLSKLLISLQG